MLSYKKVAGFLAFLVSILIVNLISSSLMDVLLGYKYLDHPGKITLIGMLMIAFLFYPTFKWLDKHCVKLAQRYFNHSSNAVGKFFGILVSFGLVFGALFQLYLQLWFGMYFWELF